MRDAGDGFGSDAWNEGNVALVCQDSSLTLQPGNVTYLFQGIARGLSYLLSGVAQGRDQGDIASTYLRSPMRLGGRCPLGRILCLLENQQQGGEVPLR